MKLTALVDVPASVLNQALVLENTKMKKQLAEQALALQGKLFAEQRDLQLLAHLLQKIAPIEYDNHLEGKRMSHEDIRTFITNYIPQLLA